MASSNPPPPSPAPDEPPIPRLEPVPVDPSFQLRVHYLDRRGRPHIALIQTTEALEEVGRAEHLAKMRAGLGDLMDRTGSILISLQLELLSEDDGATSSILGLLDDRGRRGGQILRFPGTAGSPDSAEDL